MVDKHTPQMYVKMIWTACRVVENSKYVKNNKKHK